MPKGPTIQEYDLGRLSRGATVVVTLRGSAANVRLMNGSNLRAFKNGKNHRYRGGLVKRSPHRIKVPSTGHWYLTVDLMGLKGNVKTSLQIEPPPLATARSEKVRSQSVLQGIDHEPPRTDDDGRTWDVFICHASEDKATVAEPLYWALVDHGLSVWLDSAELKIGDDLRSRIAQGIRRSTFSVVVLSPSFFTKGWAQHELGGIVGLTIAGKQRMLPIWHHITEEEIADHDPSLVNKIALATSEWNIEQIASEISQVIQGGYDEDDEGDEIS